MAIKPDQEIFTISEAAEKLSEEIFKVLEMLRNKKREGRVPQLNFFRLGKFEMKVP